MPVQPRPSARRTAAAAALALFAGLLPALLGGAPASAALPTDWVGSWGAAPMAGQDNGCTDCTIRNLIRVSKGGSQVRVTFSNRFGSGPLRIGAATVARPATSTTAKVRPGTMTPLRFGGDGEVVIPAGATATSDPAELAVEDAGSILVTTYTPGYSTPMTVHDIGSQLSFFTRGRDASHAETADAFPERTEDRHFVTRVDVMGESAGTVVAFGDSITDGVGSGQNNNTRYPDFLSARLASGAEQLAIVNSGISGNRVLVDGTGERALDRFDRDVLDVPGVRSVIILEGINDIMTAPNGTDVGSLIGGLQALVDRAHAEDVRVVLGTLTPFRGWSAWTPEREASRLAVNEWVRAHDGVEGIADFDAALRDPADPTRMLPVLDSGDRLHPGDAGYAAMADVVPLDALAEPYVPDPPAAQVEFTQQPAELVSVDAGGDVTLTAAAQSNRGAVAYQWQRRGVGTGWSDVPGATASSLALKGVNPPQGGEQYRVVAGAGGVSTTSGIATLVVRATAAVPPAVTPPATAATVPSDVRLRLSGTRLGKRPRAHVRPSAAGSVRLIARRGKVRVVRVVTVTPGTSHRVLLPRTLTSKAGKLVVQATLTPAASTDLPSRSTLYTVVRR
ncbi:SGNH/GDSL hydrolase family protein [Nocardioides sp.]|uniref:SGNH/GDSL hydrolase family protein n=1 Tax=Nocardioides sp. TaxID=35761 RepID=UPI002602505B|nr:SGNH/GDSL hydrolase family protein [Nocardioides sp.]MCW2738492.1 hydrolase [Nocardioides sp.]